MPHSIHPSLQDEVHSRHPPPLPADAPPSPASKHHIRILLGGPALRRRPRRPRRRASPNSSPAILHRPPLRRPRTLPALPIPPIIIHLRIQLILRLLRPAPDHRPALLIRPPTAPPSPTPTSSSSSSSPPALLPPRSRTPSTLPRRPTPTARRRRPRPRHIAVQAVGHAAAGAGGITAVAAPAAAAVAVAAVVPSATAVQALEEAPLRALEPVEEAAALAGVSARRRGGRLRHDGDLDREAVGVLAVVVGDGVAGVAVVFVGDEGGAEGAAGAVVEDFGGEEGAFAGEEVLCGRVVSGWGVPGCGRGECTWRSDSLSS